MNPSGADRYAYVLTEPDFSPLRVSSGLAKVIQARLAAGWWLPVACRHKFYLPDELWKKVLLEMKGHSIKLVTGL